MYLSKMLLKTLLLLLCMSQSLACKPFGFTEDFRNATRNCKYCKDCVKTNDFNLSSNNKGKVSNLGVSLSLLTIKYVYVSYSIHGSLALVILLKVCGTISVMEILFLKMLS